VGSEGKKRGDDEKSATAKTMERKMNAFGRKDFSGARISTISPFRKSEKLSEA